MNDIRIEDADLQSNQQQSGRTKVGDLRKMTGRSGKEKSPIGPEWRRLVKKSGQLPGVD